MITRYIVGDICETELKYIAHGVNCQNKMGSGVAKALYTKFPEVKRRYHSFNSAIPLYMRLGSVHTCVDGETKKDEKIIYNMFTQYNYGYDKKRYVNYAAMAKCFEILTKSCRGEILAIPKIGCGLAGGDWKFVEQLINDTVGDDLEIWVYELEPQRPSGRNDLA